MFPNQLLATDEGVTRGLVVSTCLHEPPLWAATLAPTFHPRFLQLRSRLVNVSLIWIVSVWASNRAARFSAFLFKIPWLPHRKRNLRWPASFASYKNSPTIACERMVAVEEMETSA